MVLPLPTLRRLRGPCDPVMLPVAAWLPPERARCLSAAGSRDPTDTRVPEGTARSQALWWRGRRVGPRGPVCLHLRPSRVTTVPAVGRHRLASLAHHIPCHLPLLYRATARLIREVKHLRKRG